MIIMEEWMKMEAWVELWVTQVRQRWRVKQRLKERTAEKHWNLKSEEADWLIVGGQEDDWISLMMSVMSLTAWESRSDVKNSVAAENRGKQPDEWLRIFLIELEVEVECKVISYH